MKTVLVLGAGMVAKPLVDYFIERCGFTVILADQFVSKAEKIVDGRKSGRAVEWEVKQVELLENLLKGVVLVVSLLPPSLHAEVGRVCLKMKKGMVTASYVSSDMAELDGPAKSKGVTFLNEAGEDPGLDHMETKKIVDEITGDGGKVLSIASYGAGLPSFENNRNPFGFKFSWSPRGLVAASKVPAVYLKDGEVIKVSPDVLFDHHRLVEVDDLGTFETYPNRDSRPYLKHYGLDDNVSLYRGLLRFFGWCNTVRRLKKLDLLDDSKKVNFKNKTYAKYADSLAGIISSGDAVRDIADFLEIEINDDFMKRLKWLGLFENKRIPLEIGTNADLLIGLMLEKMRYKPHEKDMTIVHVDVVAQFGKKRERRVSTMMLEGIPHGDSAMSRSVSLPAGVASKLIVQGKIKTKGVLIPCLPEIYIPVLEELEGLGIKFRRKKISLP